MSMFIKILKNKIYLLGIFFIFVWIIGNVIFFACSFSDVCIIKKPNTNITDERFLPDKNCKNELKLGSSVFTTKNNIDIMIQNKLYNYLLDKYHNANNSIIKQPI